MRSSRYNYTLATMLTLMSFSAAAQEVVEPQVPTAAPETAQAVTSAPVPTAAPATAQTTGSGQASPEASASTAPVIEIGPQEEKILQAFKPSYGTVGPSILYPNDSITTLKGLLDDVERIIALGGKPVSLAVEERSAGEIVNEDGTKSELPTLQFPVFHVASVVYRGGNDWMLWINGQRVTPKRQLTEVQILSVRPDQVQIGWKPDNWEYRNEVWRDGVSGSAQLQKLKSRQGSVSLNEENQMLVATMRPNQTLVTAGPLLVEGNHPDFAASVAPKVQVDEAVAGEEAEIVAETAAEKPSLFSGKSAQEHIENMAKKNADEVSQNSANELEKKVAPVAAAGTSGASPSPSPQPAEQTPVSAPAPAQNIPAPQTLDDILKAVSEPSQP